MGQVISFINMKGGVGKTTLAVNVAYGLAYAHAKKVLLLLPALIKERYQSFSPAQSKYEVLSLVSRDCCVSESTTP